MAFKLVKRTITTEEPFEYYLGTDSEAYTLGEALVQTSGRLTKCAATSTPEFICMKTQAAETTAATPIPVVRIGEYDIFSTTSTATVAATLTGAKVTIATDGLTVTATTTNGVFEITYTDGTTTNSNVQGMFRR